MPRRLMPYRNSWYQLAALTLLLSGVVLLSDLVPVIFSGSSRNPRHLPAPRARASGERHGGGLPSTPSAARGHATPTPKEIYQALRSGRLAEAQRMIARVLRGQPDSAEAHYVAAEVDAAAHEFALARRELTAAERLAPGLPFVSRPSVSALERELDASQASGPDRPRR